MDSGLFLTALCSTALAHRFTLNVRGIGKMLTLNLLRYLSNSLRFHFHIAKAVIVSRVRGLGHSGLCLSAVVFHDMGQWALFAAPLCISAVSHHTHICTHFSVTCRLHINWQAAAFSVFVTHFRHPSVKCVREPVCDVTSNRPAQHP